MDMTKLVFKVLDGQATHSEVGELNRWIMSNELNRSEYHGLKMLWEDGRDGILLPPDESYEQGFHSIKKAIKQHQQKRKRYRTILTVIIGVVILLLSYLLITRFQAKNHRPGVLVFNHVSLDKLADAFQQEYDIEILLPESMRQCKFNGAFYNDSPEGNIRIIAESLGIEYTVERDRIFKFKGGGCKKDRN
jgi:ferric-dicitrate binding protein FerR (iron transport regulator)